MQCVCFYHKHTHHQYYILFCFKVFNSLIIIININKIIADYPSVGLCKFYNRNAIHKFQFIW